MAVAVGMEWVSPGLVLPIIVVQSMLVGGCHAAIISQLALYYPSAIRATAGGYASAIGKMGGVVGPIIGAVILESGIPAVRTYAIAAICPAILAISIVLINAIVRRPRASARARAAGHRRTGRIDRSTRPRQRPGQSCATGRMTALAFSPPWKMLCVAAL